MQGNAPDCHFPCVSEPQKHLSPSLFEKVKVNISLCDFDGRLLRTTVNMPTDPILLHSYNTCTTLKVNSVTGATRVGKDGADF